MFSHLNLAKKEKENKKTFELGVIYLQFKRWGNRGLVILSNLPDVTGLTGRAGIPTRPTLLWKLRFFPGGSAGVACGH